MRVEIVNERDGDEVDEQRSSMYLPTLTEDEFIENIESENFFRKFGNPAIIRTKEGESFIVLSAELYDRMAELCDFPETKELIEHEPRT